MKRPPSGGRVVRTHVVGMTINSLSGDTSGKSEDRRKECDFQRRVKMSKTRENGKGIERK